MISAMRSRSKSSSQPPRTLARVPLPSPFWKGSTGKARDVQHTHSGHRGNSSVDGHVRPSRARLDWQAVALGLGKSSSGKWISIQHSYASKPCMAVCSGSMAPFDATPEARRTEGNLESLTFDSPNWKTSEAQLPIARRKDADRKVSWRYYS